VNGPNLYEGEKTLFLGTHEGRAEDALHSKKKNESKREKKRNKEHLKERESKRHSNRPGGRGGRRTNEEAAQKEKGIGRKRSSKGTDRGGGSLSRWGYKGSNKDGGWTYNGKGLSRGRRKKKGRKEKQGKRKAEETAKVGERGDFFQKKKEKKEARGSRAEGKSGGSSKDKGIA